VKCPYCNGESAVIDSRASADGVRRRRECPDCKRRFTTYERVGDLNIKVTKRSGKTEPFSTDKLITALTRICRDRPNISEADIRRLARSIEAQLSDERLKSVDSGHLAELVLERLIGLDKPAYDRLAINYIENGVLRTSGRSQENSDQLGLFGAEEGDGE
jgi:transcriptional repressor NrdR